MGGFLGVLGGIGKGIVERSVANRLANRYRQQNPGAGQEIAGPGWTGQPAPPIQPPQPPQPGVPPSDDAGPMGYDNAARGVLVTKPIIARVGENGPEAIVPLNNNAGNKVRPDLLEGHLAPPHVPGMRYQKFKGYKNPAY
jgi:hypothetical protein